ncbi:AI-2E family transporter [Aquihabitans sp. G128]|uniref:AI-2E family transporter n=1 Tax=Aquihabitans sp. G128 TaxID=2849779 RepID=UPI001C233B0F|nr:AI-2E family transporter [Aquihabitans sp. G128]QXC62844.1 AI-2E family transporter [Aquihabitans sp. G128]
MDQERREVDVRHVALTTLVVVSVTLVSVGAVLAVGRLWKVVTYLMVAMFFAVVLTPPIDFFQHKLKMRRGIATFLVFLIGLAALSGLIYAFVKPLVDQGRKFSDNVPTMVEDAQKGKGPVGRLVKKYKLQDWVDDNRETIDKQARAAGGKGLSVVQSVFSGIIAAVTVLVLTVLLVVGGPDLSEATVNILPERHRQRVRRVAADAAKAVSGYMFGNVVISIVAGISAYVFLRIAGVPYPEVLALWVAFADLIPLVGATLGAVPTIGFAFLHSLPAGIAAIVFFVIYQQFENNVLQVTVMARTVNVNALGIFVSVLVGVELFGLLGALLAIPAAGVIQVVVRDLWDEHQGRLKEEPSIGTSETPLSEATPS